MPSMPTLHLLCALVMSGYQQCMHAWVTHLTADSQVPAGITAVKSIAK